jgi:hypothetical protein
MPSCRYAVRLCCSRSGVSSHERVIPRNGGSRHSLFGAAAATAPSGDGNGRRGEIRPGGSGGELGRSA